MQHFAALYHRLADLGQDVAYAARVHRNVLMLLLGQALVVGGLAMVWLPLALLVPGVELSGLALFRELPAAAKRPRRPREVMR